MKNGLLKALTRYSASSSSDEEIIKNSPEPTVHEDTVVTAEGVHEIPVNSAKVENSVVEADDEDDKEADNSSERLRLHEINVDGLPTMAHQIKFRVLSDGHGVSCLEVTPNGRRLVVGSDKGIMLVYNIAQMQMENSPSEQWGDYEGRAIKLIKFDGAGRQMAICFGEPYLSVKDNANTILWETYPGDMYVRDSAKTFGHVHQINEVVWADEYTILTCADDTTARVFDCRTPPRGLDQRITSSMVFKSIDSLNRSITNVTLVTSIVLLQASPKWPDPLTNKSLLLGSCADGSVQIWEASWPSGLKSRKPLKIVRDLSKDPIFKIASSDNLIFLRTNEEIICYDLLLQKERARVKVTSNLQFSPMLAVYRATESKCCYVLTINDKNALCWYSDELVYMKALDVIPDLVTSLLVTKADNQILVGTRSGYCYGYWAEVDHTNRVTNAVKGLALIKEDVPGNVVSGLAVDIHTSYSIYELPQNYKLYNDDVIKEVKPRRGRLRESKLPRRQ